MSKIYTALLSACLLVLSFSASSQTNDVPVKTIPSLDMQRYMGTWYEIAKYPNWFQRKCMSDTKAVYSARADGTLKVLNSCKSADGNLSEAEGTARQIGAKDSPKLEVRFAPVWLSFLTLVWGDYWVIDLDPQYQIAVVSDPRREYLWILSRTPQLDRKVYEEVLQRIQNQQFDVSKLELTSQAVSK